jgi:hypothetical protein
LHNYQLLKNNVWVPSLETDRNRSSSNHGRWIQRLHRRVSGTLQVTLHLPQIPLVGPHTGYLQTHYIVCAQDLQSCNSVKACSQHGETTDFGPDPPQSGYAWYVCRNFPLVRTGVTLLILMFTEGKQR